MSGGQFDVTVPHFCGQQINVSVVWSHTPGVRTLRNGDPGYPDDWDEEWHFYIDEKEVQRCTKCGVDLGFDSLFENSIKAASKDQYDDGGWEPDFDLEEDEDGFEKEWPDEEADSLDQATEEQS